MNADIQKIIQNPLFLRLKDIIENNAFHNHESVFDHLVKTKDIAFREINGNFITNPDAKKLFLGFVNEKMDGRKRGDLMILAALLHDVGKLETPQVIVDCMTQAPGHEAKGGEIVPRFLEGLSLTDKQIEYISKIVGTHNAFQEEYLSQRGNLPIQDIVNDMKSKPDGLYIESMFNNFCDVYDAEPFQPYKDLVIKIFSEPKLYV